MINLRGYQKELVNKALDSLDKNKRVILQSHVGSGKTIMALAIINSYLKENKRVIFVAPRRQLIYQTATLLNTQKIQYGVIMAGERPFSQPPVQICSLDTVTTRLKSGRILLPEGDLIIVDEAHMAFTKNRLEFIEKYPHVLGLTATPIVKGNKGMGAFYSDMVLGKTVRELQELGYLVPFRYFIGVKPDTSRLVKRGDDYTEKSLDEVYNKKKIIGEIYENWARLASGRKTLIFAVNRAHARHIHDVFEVNGHNVAYIDGDTDAAEREQIRQGVESGSIDIVVNIGVMVAGVDWPKINCIVMARQTRSISTWIQCLGRGSRPAEGKEDCIVLYHGDNFTELGAIEDFNDFSLNNNLQVVESLERKKRERERKDIECPECGFVFRGMPRCPQCKIELPERVKKIIEVNARLVEADLNNKKKTKKKSSVQILREMDGRILYRMLLGIARKRGYKDGWAYYKYIEIRNEKPKKIPDNVPVLEPIEEIGRYFRYLAIKKNKGRAKYKRLSRG